MVLLFVHLVSLTTVILALSMPTTVLIGKPLEQGLNYQPSKAGPNKHSLKQYNVAQEIWRKKHFQFQA